MIAILTLAIVLNTGGEAKDGAGMREMQLVRLQR